MSKQDPTLYESLEELQTALGAMLLQLAYVLRIDRLLAAAVFLLDSLTARLVEWRHKSK